MNMAVPFVSRKRLNPQNLDAEAKYYAAPAYISEIDVNDIASEISENTTLTPTEVFGVVRSFLNIVPKYLLLGYKVRLDGFGIFKAGFSGTKCGHEKATEVSADDIKGLKVLYTPDTMLKNKLENPTFVKLDSKYLPAEEKENVS